MTQYSLDIERPVVLIGAGGHCRVIVDCLKAVNANIASYFAPQKSEWLEKMGAKYVDESKLFDLASQRFQMIMSFIGRTPESLEARYQEMESLIGKGALFPSIIHPTAFVSDECSIGMGVQVFAGAVVNVNSVLNSGCIINSNATVEHDTFIGKGVHVAPNATVLGAAQIGNYAYLGSSSVIIQERTIEKKSFIKALSLC